MYLRDKDIREKSRYQSPQKPISLPFSLIHRTDHLEWEKASFFSQGFKKKKKNSDSNGDRWILVNSEKHQDVILTNF